MFPQIFSQFIVCGLAWEQCVFASVWDLFEKDGIVTWDLKGFSTSPIVSRSFQRLIHVGDSGWVVFVSAIERAKSPTNSLHGSSKIMSSDHKIASVASWIQKQIYYSFMEFVFLTHFLAPFRPKLTGVKPFSSVFNPARECLTPIFVTHMLNFRICY